MAKEGITWSASWKLEKYEEDLDEFDGTPDEFYATYTPYEVIKSQGNLALNEGLNNIWTLVCGGAATPYSASFARIGVGDSSTAATASQTDLQASTNKLYKGLDLGFPVYGTNQLATFKASFTGSEANFVWNEWTVDNGASSGLNLNRKVENLGTKSGGTWTLSVDLTIA